MADELNAEIPPASTADPIEEAQQAIYGLFRDAYIDENHATAALLAIGVGSRRVKGGAGPRGDEGSGPAGVCP
jgi:hypothetical protein